MGWQNWRKMQWFNTAGVDTMFINFNKRRKDTIWKFIYKNLDLFFFLSRSHQKVSTLEDMLHQVQCPPGVIHYYPIRTESLSLSASGHLNSDQGSDFIHEEKKELVRYFLPPGSIGSTTWKRVCSYMQMGWQNSRKMQWLPLVWTQCYQQKMQRHNLEVTMGQREVRSSGVSQLGMISRCKV